MSKPKRQMNLNLFLMGTGHHEASWRHPEAHPERTLDIRYYQGLARRAEEAKMDSLFLADGLSNWGASRHSRQGGLEPFTFLSALAAVTEIGLLPHKIDIRQDTLTPAQYARMAPGPAAQVARTK